MHRYQLFCLNQEIYLIEYMQVAKHWLFHDGGSCPIETSPLICSANQWTGFCMIGTSVMKDSRRFSSTYIEGLFLHVVKHNFLFFVLVFFSIWFFFHEYSRFAGHQVNGKAIFWYPFYHFHPLYRHLDISRVIAGEISPLRITGSRNRTWNIWCTLFRIHPFYTCTGSCCC